MSKSIKVLLLTLLALSLAFSAAFATPTAVKVTVNATNAASNASTITQVNPITITISATDGTLGSTPTGTIGVQYMNGTQTTWTDLTSTATEVTALQFTFTPTGNSTALPVQLNLDAPLELGKVGETYTVTIDSAGNLVAEAEADTTDPTTDPDEQENPEVAGAGADETPGEDDVQDEETDTTAATIKAKLDSTKLTLTVGTETTFTYESDLELTGTYGTPVTFDMTASAIITGVLASVDTNGDIETVGEYDAPTEENAEEYGTVFLADKDALLTGKISDATATICLSYDVDENNYFSYFSNPQTGYVLLYAVNGLTSEDESNGTYKFDTVTLGVAKIEEDYFDSSDITVFDGVSAQTTSASKTKTSAQLYVALSADVSIDIAETDEVISVSWDSTPRTADTNDYYVISSKDMGASGDKKVVVIKFKDGLDSCDFTLTLVVSGDSSSSATAETYKLSLASTDKFVFTGSNGQSATFTASVDKYSASSALASVDASGAWGTMTFNVSSDVFADFVISVDFPASASVAAVYYREGTTGSYTDAADDYTAKVLTPLEGYYRLVFSADLVASSDGVASGDGYFGFTIQVVSVDSSSSESSSTLVEESAASVEPVTRSDGNKEIPAGRTISTKFLSNGSLTSTIVSAFFENADPVEMATPEEITAALTQLGFSASDLGDATNGYKIVGLALSDELKALLYDGMKFFVMITTDKDGSGEKALGMGVLSSKQLNLNFLPIVFKLLKNPADTNNYMTFPAGNYFVGATNDMGESNSSTSARVVFVTADDQTFTIAADEKTLLQGQNASGDAQAYTGDDDDDDDNQETSSHGSSSGCDAGFGALALLAVAGALAARKVRK